LSVEEERQRAEGRGQKGRKMLVGFKPHPLWVAFSSFCLLPPAFCLRFDC